MSSELSGHSRILKTILAHIFTGHKDDPFFCIVIFWTILLFFWLMNLMLTESALIKCEFAFVLTIFLLFFRNFISQSVKSQFFLSPVTNEHLQLLIPKNKAPATRSPMTLSFDEKLLCIDALVMEGVSGGILPHLPFYSPVIVPLSERIKFM